MHVNNESLWDAIRELMAMRRQAPVIHFATRQEPVFAAVTPVSKPVTPPEKVADQPCQKPRHQSPSHFAVSDNFGQTDFPLMSDFPDPMIFRNEPDQPTPPDRPRRKRSARNEKAARWIKAQVKKNGGIPPFKVIQGRFDLPKATASRLRKEVMIEMIAV